jgi:hypothetical protein
MLIFDRLEHERFQDGLRPQPDQAAWAASRAITLEQVVAHMHDYRL